MKNAVIIGAGPAGLTVAYELLKKTDIHPIILEKSDKIGGISKTLNYKGNRIDIGGHRFFTKSDEVNKLYNEIGKDIFMKRNRVSRIYYKNTFFDYPIKLSAKLFKNLGLKDTIISGFDYASALVYKRKETNLENFYVNKFGYHLYDIFFNGYTTKLWGVSPRELSADFGAQRVKGVSIKEVLKNAIFKNTNETSLIEEFDYPKFGPGQFYEEMARRIIEMGGEIRFNENVKEIIVNNEELDVSNPVIKSINGIECDYVFSSMPIVELINALKMDVPENVKDIANNLPYRDFNTVGILVKDLKIKDIDGTRLKDCWDYIQDTKIKCGRIQLFNNWSPFLPKDDENTVWIGMEYFLTKGDKFWNMDDENFINFAINELVIMGYINSEDVIDAVRIKQEKAYPGYFGSYKDFDEVRLFLNTFDNLYCVGRNGQHRYNNMDHSILTGIRAVECITKQEDKENVWSVNTEKEYHETK